MANSIYLVNPEITYRDAPLPYLYLLLKSYYTEFGRHADKWTWTLPLANLEGLHFEETVDYIVSGNPKIVGFSNYIWNYKLNLELGKAVKERLPDAFIVYGGPHILYKENPSWFADHPWVDIICEGGSGQGEEFMKDLLDQLAEGTYSPIDISFCVFPSLDRKTWIKPASKKFTFKWPRSMFYGSETEVQLLKHMAKLRGAKVSTLWETTRGCPYSCAYCDWGGVTGSKILIKEDAIIKNELRIMEELEVCFIEFCDANFGILKKRDIDLVEYLVERSKAGWSFTVALNGKAKNDFETNQKIDHLMMESKIAIATDNHHAVNATDPKISAAINRTFFPSQKHIDFINSTNQFGYKTRIEYILGLPEATLETFYREFDDIAASDSWLSERYVWNLIPRSPASKPEYIEKYNIQTVPVKYIHSSTLRQKLRDEYFLLDDPRYQGTYDIVVETSSYSRRDWMQMYYMDHFARGTEPSNITTNLRKELEKEGLSAGQFFQLCWQAIQDMDNAGTASFKRILDSIERALRGETYFSLYNFENYDRPIGLQTISLLHIAHHANSFVESLTPKLPRKPKIQKELKNMREYLNAIVSTEDPLDWVMSKHKDYVLSGPN